MKKKVISAILTMMMVATSLDLSGFSVRAAKDNDSQAEEQTVDGYVEFEKDEETQKVDEMIGSDAYVRFPQPTYNGKTSGKSVSTQSDLPESFNTTLDPDKVRNQGSWGTCWAHSSNTNFERLTELIAGNENINLSEEYMLKKLSKYGDLGYTISTKDNGGNFSMASGYFMGAYGPMYEQDYEYTTDDLDADEFDVAGKYSEVRATSVMEFVDDDYQKECTDGNLKYQLTEDIVNQIKTAVKTYGSVSASIYFDDSGNSVVPSDSSYDPIVAYNEENGAYCYPWNATVNHAVTIVGWNDNYSKENFASDVENDGAWIIQNSWGTSIGDQGYNYVSYEDGSLIAQGTVTGFELFNEDETMYQLDDAGSCGTSSFLKEDDSDGYMNVFELKEDSQLESVSFYCPFGNETCRIYKVPIDEEGNPEVSERTLISEDFTTPYKGYYTIEMNDGVEADAGKIGIYVEEDGVTVNGASRVGIGREVGIEKTSDSKGNDRVVSIATGESYLVYEIDGNGYYQDATYNYDTKELDNTVTNGYGYGNYSIKLKAKAVSESTHTHSYTEEITKEASCTEAGEATYTCECGDSYTEVIPATGHDWEDDYTVDKKASCTEAGSESIHCKNCDATKDEEEIPATGHTEVKDEAVAATCTETGLTEGSHCSVCQAVITKQEPIPALGHDWDKENGTVTKEATCTEDGNIVYTCKRCDATLEEAISALGHSWNADYTIDKEASCEEDGSKSIHCANCDAVQDVTTIPATGHSWNSGEITKEATCTEAGEKTYTCTNEGCGKTKTEAIEATGHTEVKDEAVAATCTETGLEEGSHCSVCGNVIKEQKVIPALGHDWDEGTITKESTCTAKGNKLYTCKRCDATLEEAIDVDKNAHSWNADYTIDKEASCTIDGSKSIHCANCDAVKDVTTIPATGHDWSDWEEVSVPSINGTGHQRSCKVCGKVEVEDLTLRVAVKKTQQINLSDLLYGSLSYSVANKKIATVSSTGLVKGVKVGTTSVTIKASGDDTHAASEITITVQVPTTVTKATLSKTSFTYNGSNQMPTIKNVNNSKKLVEGTDYEVEWPEESVKPGTYSVKITGIGKYIGTVTKSYKINKANQSISVTAPTVYVNETGKLEPQSGSNSFTYKSSSTKTATVDADGTIHGIKSGTVTITITAAADECYNKATKSVKVKIVKKNQTFEPALDFEAVDGKYSLTVGNTAKVINTEGVGKITYSTSNKKYATVGSDGTITAKKKGTVKIIVKAAGDNEYNAATKTFVIYVTN